MGVIDRQFGASAGDKFFLRLGISNERRTAVER